MCVSWPRNKNVINFPEFFVSKILVGNDAFCKNKLHRSTNAFARRKFASNEMPLTRKEVKMQQKAKKRNKKSL